jgi:hypothetical protein
MNEKGDPKKSGMTPEQAANEVQPSATKKAADPDLDPREEEGWDQPESSAQKLPEPPGAGRS